MPHYEHIFMVRQDASNATVEELTEHYKSVIADNEGSIGKVEYWGVKSLAYRIRKNRKAHYTLMNITAPPAALAEMERQMSLNEEVVRFLTLRMDELDEEPSVMVRPARRDERRDDGRPERRGDRDDRPRDRDDRPRRDGPRDGPREGARESRPARSEEDQS
jgi:small subunit ribosomal protein S6